MFTTAERIRIAREKAGYSQRELANMVGVNYASIYKYENSLITNIPITRIDAIARACDVSPAWLLCIDDEQQSSVKSELLALVDTLTDEQCSALLALLKK